MSAALDGSFLRLPIAHRALHDARSGIPENSLAAVSAAIAGGYGMEVDIQPSSDGQAMVFHDATLERLTDQTGRVDQRTALDLSQIPLKNSEERIPRLTDLLDLVQGRVPLLIEIKDQSGNLGEVSGELERAVAQDLKGYDGPVAVMSFNPASVERMQHYAPRVTRGLTTCSFPPDKWNGASEARCAHLRDIADFDRLGAAFISHDCNDLDRASVLGLKARGVPILCWTIKSAEAEAQARKIADNVTFEGYLATTPTA